MWGTRFLSAFLKVNPYFTLCLAVGFSGVAAIGFNHRETEKSLNKLIPLHLRSLAPDHAPDISTSDVQGMEHAREVIQNVLRPQGGELPHAAGSFGHVLLSDPPVAPIRHPDDPLIGAGLPIDYGFARDVPDPPRAAAWQEAGIQPDRWLIELAFTPLRRLYEHSGRAPCGTSGDPCHLCLLGSNRRGSFGCIKRPSLVRNGLNGDVDRRA